MKRKWQAGLMSAVVSLAALASTEGLAQAEALLMLGVGGDGDFSRSLAAQDMLERRLGFDEVRVLMDVTRAEAVKEARDFLERPARKTSRRLVWLSGVVQGRHDSLCPEASEAPIHVKAMSMVLAPGCVADVIAMPASAIHVSRTSPNLKELTRRMLDNRHVAGRGPKTAVAVVRLPSGKPLSVIHADDAVLNVIRGGREIGLHPLSLLDALKTRFHHQVPDVTYRPAMDISAWHARFPGPLARRARPPAESWTPPVGRDRRLYGERP